MPGFYTRISMLLGVAQFTKTTSFPMKTLIYPPIQKTLSPENPLIDKGGEVTIYTGVFLIILLITAIVRILSQRVEHAVIAALGLSLLSIALFSL